MAWCACGPVNACHTGLSSGWLIEVTFTMLGTSDSIDEAHKLAGFGLRRPVRAVRFCASSCEMCSAVEDWVAAAKIDRGKPLFPGKFTSTGFGKPEGLLQLWDLRIPAVDLPEGALIAALAPPDFSQF